jgi:hypothetical protein
MGYHSINAGEYLLIARDSSAISNVLGLTAYQWTTGNLANSGDQLVLKDNVSFTNNTYFSLTLAKRARTLIDWKVNEEDYGSGYITSLSNDNNIDENISFSSEIIGYGMPISQLNFIYNAYSDRVFADGGAIENKKCLINYIDNFYGNDKPDIDPTFLEKTLSPWAFK